MRIGQHQNAQDLAVAAAERIKSRQQHKKHEGVDRRVDLGRVNGQRMERIGIDQSQVAMLNPGWRVDRKRNPPGKPADIAKATAVQKTPEAPEQRPHGDRGASTSMYGRMGNGRSFQ